MGMRRSGEAQHRWQEKWKKKKPARLEGHRGLESEESRPRLLPSLGNLMPRMPAPKIRLCSGLMGHQVRAQRSHRAPGSKFGGERT